MKMKRMILMSSLILAIFVVLSFPFMWTSAEAEEPLMVADGVYQVELSFQSLEVVEHERLFSADGTLTVQKGQYKLSIPMKYENKITAITVKQQGEKISSVINETENLVQFDVKYVDQIIVIDGIIKSPVGENPITFSEEISIDTKLLPQVEEQQPPIPTTPPVVEKDDNDQQETVIVDKQEQALINFTLLVDGKDDPSIMNTYVEPYLKIIKKDQKHYAQMKILNASWITGLTVEQQGNMIEPKVISLVDNIRIIQFELEDFQKKIRMWVEVDIPEIAYEHQYYVQLQFNEKHTEAETETVDFIEKPVKPGKSKPKETIVKKSSLQANTQKSGKYFAPIVTKPKPFPMEEILAFDRTLDEALEKENSTDHELITNEAEKEKQDTNSNTSQLEPLDKIKIGLLIIVCLLSCILLIRRIKNGKKTA